ncbi:hypothetical protein BD413DRAFT_132766 [Trametes elegans]|nr:hypothetical protein BD413DRAFT_132470 [Trametes elegans]KAI0768232.1 hypothetical protein BD413DRAFT_132766 [Trametes elegans]
MYNHLLCPPMSPWSRKFGSEVPYGGDCRPVLHVYRISHQYERFSRYSPCSLGPPSTHYIHQGQKPESPTVPGSDRSPRLPAPAALSRRQGGEGRRRHRERGSTGTGVGHARQRGRACVSTHLRATAPGDVDANHQAGASAGLRTLPSDGTCQAL